VFVFTLAPALWLVTTAGTRGAARSRRQVGLLACLIAFAVLVPVLFITQVAKDTWAALAGTPLFVPFFALEGLIGALAVGAIALAWLRVDTERPVSRERRFLLGAACAVAGLHLIGRAVVVASLPFRGPIRDWREVQDWCQSNLPRGARVIVPLTADGLRSRCDQIPVVDFLEGAVMTHSPRYAPEYRAKLRLFGDIGSPGSLADNLRALNALDEALTTAQVRDIARRTGAVAAVRRLGHKSWALPILFQNRAYVIYEM
jgi:hypothetical protein